MEQNDWRMIYEAALLELDPVRMPERIQQAHKAILSNMKMARTKSDAVEHQALADAMANLRVLRREVGLPMEGPPEAQERPASNRS
jgi:hypothetical protein